MLSSKLLQLLGTFSTKEMRTFSAFLASPYFNVNGEVKRFFELIRMYHPSFRKLDGGKERVFAALYPKQAYEDKTLRYLMSDLFKLAQDFVVLERFKQKAKAEQQLILLEEYTKRTAPKLFVGLRKRAERQVAEKQMQSLDHFLHRIRLADVDEGYFQQQRQRVAHDNTQQASDNLNRYYVLKKLKYACDMLNRQALVNRAYDLGLPPNWMAWLEENNYWEEEVIKAFTTVYLTLRSPDRAAHFATLNEYILANSSKVSLADRKELHLYAINHCARKMRAGEGDNAYVEKALTLYLNGINTGALLEDGYFSPWSFGNVVKLALRLERFTWIEEFMEGYNHFLPPGFRDNAMSYNLAELYCYKREFDTALTYLVRVKFSDMGYHLGSRIMLAKIYYELGEEQALVSLMNAFTTFLKRNKKISETIRKTCLNFCNALSAIQRGRIEGLEEKIRSTNLLSDRSWLLEKLSSCTQPDIKDVD